MAKTQDIKRRIRSISNTKQLTNAMKMVSAAKLRKTQERMMQARPYAERTLNILRSLALRANPESHPLLQPHGDQKIEVILVTADKGLCGPFNSALIRECEPVLDPKQQGGPDPDIVLSAVGRKGRDYFKRRGHGLERQWTDVFRHVDFSSAAEIARSVIDLYAKRERDKVFIVYNEFKSAIQAKPIVQQLLPVSPLELDTGELTHDYIYEPPAAALFAELLPHYVEIQVFRALLESTAAEHAARMTAMDAATKNAGELIESLTLTMNRVRQASITTEIIEVVSGAEALN